MEEVHIGAPAAVAANKSGVVRVGAGRRALIALLIGSLAVRQCLINTSAEAGEESILTPRMGFCVPRCPVPTTHPQTHTHTHSRTVTHTHTHTHTHAHTQTD